LRWINEGATKENSKKFTIVQEMQKEGAIAVLGPKEATVETGWGGGKNSRDLT